MTKKNEKLYYLRVTGNDNSPEYFLAEMMGKTNYLPDAGLFSEEEMAHINAIMKKKNYTAVEAIPEMEKRLIFLKNHIDGMKFERDALDCLKINIKNGTIGTMVK